MIKNKNGAIEFSFGWIFAIIAGMFILFLAIYGVTKFIGMQQSSISAQTATDIGVLTNPLESSFETVKRAIITVPADTRIYTACSNASTFGKQTIRVAQKNYNSWSEEGTNVTFQNKYIFSDSPAEGKNFYLFSKPLEIPFKVADLIYLTSTDDKYCFINAPLDIQDELKDLRGTDTSKNENLFIQTADNSCPDGSINICFGTGSNCKVMVNRVAKSVKKNGQIMYYEGDALMYAAIFSNKDYYECEVDRLMKRTGQLFDLYRDKSRLIFQKDGCSSEMEGDLISIGNMINTFQSSADLAQIADAADQINRKNEYTDCKLW